MAGFGIALGGAAKGLESAEAARATRDELGLRERQILGDQKLRERALSLQERQMRRGAQNDLLAQADKAIGDTLKLTVDTLKATEGLPPEKRVAAIEPLIAEIDELGTAIGKDTTAIQKSIMARASVPVAPSTPKVGSTLETIKSKLAQGEQLTPGEQKIYDDAQRLSLFDRMLLGQAEGGASGQAPISTGPVPLPANPTPETLKKGQVYDLPDGRQGLWNGEGFEIL